MKQKRKKTGRKLLGFLLALVLVVGPMPGMRLTAYAIYNPKGLEHFIPVLDNGGNVAFYDVSIRVEDDNQNIQRTVRLLFSTLTKEQIKKVPGWSNISSNNCYLSGDTNTPPGGSQITVSDVGIDTQDITYTTPSPSGTNALNFKFSPVSLDPNTSYYVYFILRSAKNPNYTIYTMIGDSLGTLNPMKINYNKQKTDGTYDTTTVNTHYISGQYLDVSKLGTVPTGYHINTSSSTSSGDWNGTSEINIYYDMDVDISLTPDSTTLNVGGTQALTAAIAPSKAADKTVKWSVFGTNEDAVELYSNEACTTKVGTDATETLTVYAKGISAGSATVKVTSNADETKSATCTVTVNKANAIPATVTANNCTYDGTEKPLVTVDNSTLVGGTMYYAVTTENTAPTDENLYTTSIPTATDAGTYYVWYKAVGDNDHADSEATMIEVTISEKAVTPEVKFDATTMELKAGESGSIKATVVPEDAKVQWKSDKETVATVDNTGKVTAVGVGTAKITATITVDGTQYKAECTVTVQEEPVTPEVKFDATTMELKAGKSGSIKATVVPEDAKVQWKSDKETVATVDNTGKVTAVGAGTAKITATITVDGTQYKAECAVTVAEEEPSETKPVISIDDLPDAIDGESYNYTLTAGGVQPITWSITAGSLPAGLSLESESGKISGTPTSTGTSTFTVTATNTYDSTSKEMSITVQAGSTVVDTEGSAPDDQKTAVESAPSVVRDIVGDAAGGVTESDTVRLILTTDSRDEGSVSGEEKEAVDAIKGAAEGSGLVVGTFVDLKLSYEVKNANGEITSSGQISQTARPLTVKFPIPAGLQKAGRLFKIFRYHGSNASEIGSGSGDAVDVSTDLFSIYAIAYTDDAAPDVPEGEESSEQPHVHTFAWDTRNATADTDGEMRYQCTKCGMIQTRVPISAYYIFNKETTEKIRAAKQGETVKIETRRWISFHKMVAEALAERKDVTVEVSFLDQGHKGNPYTFTIPAGTDLTPLFDESGFAGFMYLGNRFGLTEN